MRSGQRLLPDFLIIGAMRAGTTSLHHYLSLHPGIGMAVEKECDFFVKEMNWERGLPWYSSRLPNRDCLLGEASPNYTKAGVFPGVAARIAKVLPHARLIYVVRDPVGRAVSQYRHEIASGVLSPSSQAAPLATLSEKRFADVVDASLYHKQMMHYIAHFDRERILIVDFHQLVADPHAELSRIAAFLGIRDSWGVTDFKQLNTSRELTSLPPWWFRLRRSWMSTPLRKIAPQGAIQAARKVVARSAVAEMPTISAADRKRVADAVAEDADLFRKLTGRCYRDWSV